MNEVEKIHSLVLLEADEECLNLIMKAEIKRFSNEVNSTNPMSENSIYVLVGLYESICSIVKVCSQLNLQCKEKAVRLSEFAKSKIDFVRCWYSK